MMAPIGDGEVVCPPQICARGYYLHPEVCECFLICDYIMQCEKGLEWDFIECGCVVRYFKFNETKIILIELNN